MKIQYLNATDQINDNDYVLALGFFDGMHIAHKVLLSKAIEIGKIKKKKVGLMTFSTHVLSYLKKVPFSHLTSLSEKATIASSMGFDVVFVFNVSSDLVSMHPEQFIERFLTRCDTVVVGFDFTFGHRGSGTVDTLKNHSEFNTVVIDEILYHQEKVGSTRIKEALSLGQIELANDLLGYPYTISGIVIKGKGRGKYLGFPTANIDYDGNFLPKCGVYITEVILDGVRYESMTNVGINPTFANEGVTLEVYLLKWNESLYGKKLIIQFEQYMREEIKYPSTAELIHQMHLDEKNTIAYFRKKRES